MAQALADAGIDPQAVDYINAHGTSTALNDESETAAIHTVFDSHAKELMVSSTKSMTGHLLGAAGAVEAIFTALALGEGFVPATIGWQVPDPACDLDIVPNQGRTADIKIALSNSLGSGPHAAVVLKSGRHACRARRPRRAAESTYQYGGPGRPALQNTTEVYMVWS